MISQCGRKETLHIASEPSRLLHHLQKEHFRDDLQELRNAEESVRREEEDHYYWLRIATANCLVKLRSGGTT